MPSVWSKCMLSGSSLLKKLSLLWKESTHPIPLYPTSQGWNVKMIMELSQVEAVQHRAWEHMIGQWGSIKKKNIAVEMVFFSILYKLLLFLHRCCLNPCPYTQNTFHTISTLLQCRCSGDDVWRFASFVCESCSLEELANLIRIFIHWALWGRKHKERVYTVTLAFFFNACQVLVSFCSGPAAGFVSSMTCTLKGLCVWNLARSS